MAYRTNHRGKEARSGVTRPLRTTLTDTPEQEPLARTSELLGSMVEPAPGRIEHLSAADTASLDAVRATLSGSGLPAPPPPSTAALPYVLAGAHAESNMDMLHIALERVKKSRRVTVVRGPASGAHVHTGGVGPLVPQSGEPTVLLLSAGLVAGAPATGGTASPSPSSTSRSGVDAVKDARVWMIGRNDLRFVSGSDVKVPLHLNATHPLIVVAYDGRITVTA